ncbi:FAD/NAD(P)-binding protein [Gloeocapsopsis dulcis]|uniref:FAD-dependent oxidoreductase n=1 Tax=Gloeocapsopsis dulcis AAB1 = 1H9 TaxID=1433147 RepID=A0A6N8FY83_9CHRO|nr:FAD/NAD(P)-binding protein [Gloeocapsopsis dulcis]MUL36876.1 FAD-dependent oxidoreductase [Gloeocapsopsis dulcis AAB1 = 1H9]WNN88514.1 FAD/NAD(P)-binding protein [Gloeocapsopsis dulcis]
MVATLLPHNTDIAVIGAGPHAMTVVTHLLQKRQQLRQRLLVFDPSGTWMQQWQNQFAAFEIPHLRSPAVHHPDPNPFALRQFAQSRSHELYPPYDLPGTLLFQDFCQELIRRWSLQQHIVTAKVVRIEPIKHNLRSRFRLWLDNDQSIVARRVILAIGGGTPQIPAWAQQISSSYPQEKLCHSCHVDLPNLQLHGETILIIGGGLTSGHLALGAIARGAKVILISRRDLQEKLFDADPGWLGPKYLKSFWAEPDWQTRAELIQKARNGGSMTPAIMTQLRRAQRHTNIKLIEKCQVSSAVWQSNHWQISCDDGSKHKCDRVWLATGTKLNVTAEPLLTEIIEQYPIPTAKGLPVLDSHLRWAGCELFITGGLAALQVGPVARNLSGARMASDRIVPALRKPSLSFCYQ